MSNNSAFKMNLLSELEFFKLRLEKIEGNFAKKVTAERCNQLIRGAKLLLGEKVKHVEEVKEKKITESMQEAFNKMEIIARIAQLIDAVNEALNTELRG
ncbi:MAG: hypothetical protein WC419_04825 [Candidatus Omnitrophota bacterium]|jgi:hypothetical protein